MRKCVLDMTDNATLITSPFFELLSSGNSLCFIIRSDVELTYEEVGRARDVTPHSQG